MIVAGALACFQEFHCGLREALCALLCASTVSYEVTHDVHHILNDDDLHPHEVLVELPQYMFFYYDYNSALIYTW